MAGPLGDSGPGPGRPSRDTGKVWAYEVRLKPGSLWASAVSRTRHARETGALQPISTDIRYVERDGIRYIVRMLRDAIPKDEARVSGSASPGLRGFDPFLPYDEDLIVTDVTDTHICLLNKFTVIKHHLLVVTRAFEHQEAPLTPADFVAITACMAEFDGLAFYNAGPVAGASQRHRHMQIVPLPLSESGPLVPIEAVFGADVRRDAVQTLPAFRFRHAFAWLNADPRVDPLATAKAAYGHYRSMLETVELRGAIDGESDARLGPYNLLMTRRWMLLVPRSRGAPRADGHLAGSLRARTCRVTAVSEAVGVKDFD